MSNYDALDDAMEPTSGAWVKWEDRGEKPLTGTIVNVDVAQAIDFETKQPKVTKKGKPRMEIALTVQTTEREDEDDDGLRKFSFLDYSDLHRKLQAALLAASAKLRPGGVITVTYKGQKKWADTALKQHVFDVSYVAGAGAVDDVMSSATPPAAPASAAAPAGPKRPPNITEAAWAAMDPATQAAIAGTSEEPPF